MPGRGKVSLSFNEPGKQPRRHSFTDSRDFVWDSRDLFGRRMNDEEEEEDADSPSDIQPGAFPWRLPGQRNPFSKYDAGSLESVPEQDYRRCCPKSTSKGTALARNVRGLRGSPKPVTSLESCLRAQMADALSSNRVKSEPLRVISQIADTLISTRVSRPLYFSSTVDEEDVLEDAVDNNIPSCPSVRNAVDSSSNSEPKQCTLPKLPNLSKFLKECAAKLTINGKSERSNRNSDTSSCGRARTNDQKVSNSPNDTTSSTMSSFETLLFCFGMGLGVLFVSSAHKLEAERLNQLLEQTQEDLETLKLELARRKSPSRTNIFDTVMRTGSQDQHSVRSNYGPEQQENQMAELEAELEAELDQLTGRDSTAMDSQYSVMDELDMDASVVYGDLEPRGLPAGGEEDSDEDQTPPGQPACLNNYAVSPRELTRSLRKLQASRQDKLIAELEEDLEAALSTLQSRETELELWKNRVKRFTKVSFGSTSGDEHFFPDIPNEGFDTEAPAALRSVDPVISQECPYIPMQEHGAPATGSVSEEDPAEPGLHPSKLRSTLQKQESKDIGRESTNGSPDVIARDCKPILDYAQIITQLIDSVHGLESYGDPAESVEMGSTTTSHGLFSSSVSISDTVDETPERFVNGREILLPRTKIVVPHSSRRTSYNSDEGIPVLIRKRAVTETLPTADVRYTESSKSLSDMSETEHRTAELPFSINYVDSTIRPASEPDVPAEDNPSYWVGHAGLTTPVEKARQQLFKSPESAPAKWPGELSPTVLEKIARWEGLMEGETPGPATGSDWECQSRASESDGVNVFSEENLVLEAEEMLGRMLIKRIVEESKLGSDSLVKKAQSALATLERDDGIEVAAYHGDDTFMNERTDSEADSAERSDDREEHSNFLDEAVREEHEFFRRLEIIQKDRKTAKEKVTTATPDAGGEAIATAPELNVQVSPATQPFGTLEALRKDIEVQQPDDLSKEKNGKQSVKTNIRGRENWLPRGDARPDTFRTGRGYREDEVRSRRRS